MTRRTVAGQLTRSQTSLSDYQARLTSLPINELIRLSEITTTDKLPTLVVRKTANEKLSAIIFSKTWDVSLCAGTVEVLIFLVLVWCHLLDYLLYSTATAGPATHFQQAFIQPFYPINWGDCLC